MVIVMNKEKIIPEIRFAGFTDDWEQCKLEDLAESFNYGLNASAMEFDGENKYIRITDIDEQSHKFIQSGLTSPNTDLLNADDYLLKEGDILFARTGASVGKSYQYEPLDGKVYYAGFLIRARIKPEFDPRFIFQNTLTEKYNNFIKVTSQRSGQPGVNAQEYANFSILIPSRGEQVKLGNFFKQLDDTIALHQQLLSDYKQLKKAMLQQLFPQKGESVPKIRFTGFNEDWKKERLSKYLNEISDKSTVENQHTILSSTTTGIEIRDGRVSGVSNLGYKIIKKGNVVLSPQNLWMGNINYNKEFEIGLVSPSYKTFSVENAEECFLVYYLKLPKMIYSYGQASVQGASVVRRNLDIDLFNQIVVLMPNREEQEKIGNFFKQLDETIAGHELKLATYQDLKKALLQRMFV